MKRIQIPTVEEFLVKKLNEKIHENGPYAAFIAGIAYANEVIEAAEQDPKPWQPKPGDKCAFWLNQYKETCIFNVFREKDKDGEYLHVGLSFGFAGCALIETLDEIGKPPQYFIERGRCTV